MRRFTVQTASITLVALVLGWALGRAQTSAPDFEIVVNAPGGPTTIECVRGCTLAWVERGLNPNSRATAKFSFSCGASECSSGRVGGWVSR